MEVEYFLNILGQALKLCIASTLSFKNLRIKFALVDRMTSLENFNKVFGYICKLFLALLQYLLTYFNMVVSPLTFTWWQVLITDLPLFFIANDDNMIKFWKYRLFLVLFAGVF